MCTRQKDKYESQYVTIVEDYQLPIVNFHNSIFLKSYIMKINGHQLRLTYHFLLFSLQFAVIIYN